MRAIGLDRQQGAGHFVLALRTAFKAFYTLVDTPLNGLVVASLKVQTIDAL